MLKHPCRVLIAAALCALLVQLRAETSRADTPQWTNPIPLTGWGDRTQGWWPAITADKYGDVHVVWQGITPNSQPERDDKAMSLRLRDDAVWLRYTRGSGERWTPPNEIAATIPAGAALRSAITVDPGGELHLCYRGIDVGAPETYRSGETIRCATAESSIGDDARAWTRATLLSQPSTAYFPEVVSDSRGVLHAMWTESGMGSTVGVFYRRSVDGGRTWTDRSVLEKNLAASQWRLQLIVGPFDDLHAVWEIVSPHDATSRDPVGFVYAVSRDGGGTWSRKEFLPELSPTGIYGGRFEGTNWRVQPAVGVDGRGRIILVWREFGTDLIYSQQSLDGQTWSAPQRLPGVGRGAARPFDRYAMVRDSAGFVHLAFVGFPTVGHTMALMHSEWIGYGWSEPDLIQLASTSLYPEWPRAVIGNGNRLHIVWFNGDAEDVSRNPVGVWYSTALTSAPAVASEARPAAPIAAPTEASIAAESPAPSTPVDEETESAATGGRFWDVDVNPDSNPNLVLVLSVLPVMLVLLAAAGLRRLRWVR